MTNNFEGKIKAIRVVGDVTEDILLLGEAPSLISRSPGGAFFVYRMLKKALIDKGVEVLGYQLPEPGAFNSFLDTSNFLKGRWKIELLPKGEHDNKVMRYLEKPFPDMDRSSGNSQISPTIPGWEQDQEEFQMLVVEDLSLSKEKDWSETSFLKRSLTAQKEWERALQHLSTNEFCVPNIIAMANCKLPDFQENFWAELQSHHKRRTLVIIYADTLRYAGLNISRHVSWERTAQDFLSELYTHPVMKKLGEFQHLVVRFGVTGAIHSYRIDEGKGEKTTKIASSFFRSNEKNLGTYRDSDIEGHVVGMQAIFATSIIKEIVGCSDDANICSNEYKIIGIISDGIRKAIKLCQKHFDKGYGTDDNPDRIQVFMENGGFEDDLFNDSDLEKNLILDERIPVGNPSWSLLDQSAEYDLVPLAEDIVLMGIDNVLNNPDYTNGERPPVSVPVLKFGGEQNPLIIVDRRELESYRIVHRLMTKAVRNPEKSPLSVAVFGPPGSGKSFLTKMLAASISGANIQIEVCNLSKLSEPSDLETYINSEKLLSKLAENRMLTEPEYQAQINDDEQSIIQSFRKNTPNETLDIASIRDSLKKKILEEIKDNIRIEIKEGRLIPLIFFDEVDSDLKGKELGWLKYFLQPMQDWEWEKECKYTPLFFFAGGTSRTYLDFTRENLSLNDEQKLRFGMAKGPDFVSRLRGHIDILGPNPVDEYDQAYIVRRATLLRSILEKRLGRPSSEKLGERVAREIIRAMLKTSRYKHGTRSMEAVISMCVPLGAIDGKYIPASLPTLPQLSMHVNGQEFVDRVIEARRELQG